MKKVFLIMVMIFTMSVCSFAEGNGAVTIVNAEKYELKISHHKLADALGVTNEQMEMFNNVITEFENDMIFASHMESEDSSNKIVANAVKKNIRNMHYILDDKQYHKYLMFLNLTLNHRGINVSEITK